MNSQFVWTKTYSFERSLTNEPAGVKPVAHPTSVAVTATTINRLIIGTSNDLDGP